MATHPNRWKKKPEPDHMLTMGEYNNKPITKPTGNVWFLNGDLVRVYHRDRSSGILTLYNINQDCLQTVLIDEWIRKRKHAYTVKQAGALVNRHPKYLAFLVKVGDIPPPRGSSPGGERGIRIRAYYSEDDIFELREIFSQRHWGAPRKDGLHTNNRTPTVQELKRRMGLGLLQYTKNEKGEVVPIWSETID